MAEMQFVDASLHSHVTRVWRLNKFIGNEMPDRPGDAPSEARRRSMAMLVIKEAVELCVGLGFTVDVTPKDAPVERNVYGDKGHHFKLEKHSLGFDFVEVADGVADLNVVAVGAALQCGINPVPVQALVDHANLRKFDPVYVESPGDPDGKRVATPQEAKERGLGGYREWEGVDAGKWIKPKSWKDVMPDIAQEIERQRKEGAFR